MEVEEGHGGADKFSFPRQCSNCLSLHSPLRRRPECRCTLRCTFLGPFWNMPMSDKGDKGNKVRRGRCSEGLRCRNRRNFTQLLSQSCLNEDEYPLPLLVHATFISHSKSGPRTHMTTPSLLPGRRYQPMEIVGDLALELSIHFQPSEAFPWWSMLSSQG